MVKSKNRKINDIKSRVPDRSKRDNPNRGKHGCSRLHELSVKQTQQVAEPIKITPAMDKPTGLMGRIKNIFRK